MFGITEIEAMSPELFTQFSLYINDQIGIHMPDNKRFMLQSRLQRRVRELSLDSYRDYYDFLLSAASKNDEKTIFINLVTTNKTDFFREKKHFDFMTNTLLPFLTEEGQKSFSIWSSACSSGEEPYTLAMVLDQYSQKKRPLKYNIYASDISTEVLSHAQKGIYRADLVNVIPDELKSRYFLAGNSDRGFFYKVKDEIRSNIQFQQQNLMDSRYWAPNQLDAVFCRNVLIYFEKAIKIQIISKLITHLKPGGHLFLGHTETVFGMGLPLESVAPAVYRKI